MKKIKFKKYVQYVRGDKNKAINFKFISEKEKYLPISIFLHN